MARTKHGSVDVVEGKLQQLREMDYPGGVAVEPTPITTGSDVTVLYYGLLAQAGADQVWMHTGYGSDQRWDELYDHPMERTGFGWVKKFNVSSGERFHFCFKDSAANWDNNDGNNWNYEIHHGAQR